MVAQHRGADARIPQQERPELLGKHVEPVDAVPDLAAHLVLIVARLRNAAEIAVGHVLDLVVVVEHHAVEPGHAEVLVQHVAREDVGRRQLLDRVAVLADRVVELGVGGLLQVDVQRRHAPLDVDVPQHHLLVVDVDAAAAEVEQLADQRRRAAVTRQRDLRVLPGVGHAPDPIVHLHELVLAHDGRAIGLLRMRDHVLDDLEHVRIRRQREHRHHQALDAGRDDERIGRVLQVMQEVAEEQRLALLLQADHRVQLGGRLLRQQRPEKVHVGAGRLHVDQEVGAREREQRADAVGREQDGVQVDLAARVAHDRHRERRQPATVDDAADQERALVAEEQVRQHLDLAVGLDVERPRQRRTAAAIAMRLAGGAQHPPQVALHIDPRAGQPEVDGDPAQRAPQAVRGRVVAAVGRRIGVHVLGRHPRPHEQELVAEVLAVQQLGADRVEEGLGALRLPMVGQQRDETGLDRLPDEVALVVGQRIEIEVALDALEGLAHALVVEVDPLARRRPHRLPLAMLEAALGLLRNVAEQRVVAVERVEDRARDRRRRGHRAVDAGRGVTVGRSHRKNGRRGRPPQRGNGESVASRWRTA